MAETEKQKDIYILGIESSCDETAASVVKNGREVLSNVISSQIALHTLYGGVVPEIASRKHIEKINQVIEQALADAHVTLEDITAIAVTYGPGLVGALLVGVSEAKAISFATGIPLVGVHHIEGHISANFIENKELEPPFICLVASGGHSHLVVVKDYGEYEIIGRTRDDAAGEAFDKVARAIGRFVKMLKQMYEDFKEETGLDETINEFQDASRDLSNTLRDADPRRELREVQRDAQKVIKEAEKEVKSDK